MIYFSGNIRFLRKIRGMTQSDVAKAMEVNATSVVQWESGRSTPQFSILVKLRHFFGVNMEALIFHDLSQEHPPDKHLEEMNSEDLKQIQESLRAIDSKLARIDQDKQDEKQKLEERLALLERKLSELSDRVQQQSKGK